MKNVGISRSERATEPQTLPEGMVVSALCVLKASAAPEGIEENENIIGGIKI